MKLIGAGLPRTATTTQKVALEMLGMPCYHMRDLMADFADVPTWQRAADGHPVDWNALFEGYTSTVDWPAAYFYRELMEAYPDAKVLLSVRDGESWERSMRDTVWAIYFGDSLIHHLARARYHADPKWRGWFDLMVDMNWTGRGAFAGSYSDRESMIAGMERWNDEVRATVPADRLLEWHPKDGWKPLCEFVGADVPSEPVPNVNDTQAFKYGIMGGAVAALNEWWEQDRAERAA